MPDNRVVTLAEPRIETVEALALEFTGEESQTPLGQKRVAHSIVAATITHVDGKPVNPADFNPRREWPCLRDWNRLEKAFDHLLGVSELLIAAIAAAREAAGQRRPRCRFQLPGNRNVEMRSLELEEDQLLQMETRHSPREWYSLGMDRAALGIAAIDGTPVVRETFDPRATFPLYSDWLIIITVFCRLTIEEEDVQDFLIDTPGSLSTTPNSPG